MAKTGSSIVRGASPARRSPRRTAAKSRRPGPDRRLSTAILDDLLEDWETHGAAAIANVRSERPHDYLKLITSFFVREDNAKVNLIDELTDAQIGAQLFAVLRQLEAAGIVPGPGAGAAPKP